MPAFIIDTETTGVVEPEVIQLAWLQSNLFQEELGVHAVGSQMFKPIKPIELGARAVHHILDADLEGLEPYRLEELYLLGLSHDDEVNTYWIGHNIDFDWEACGKPPVRRICTLALARYFHPELDTHKLGALMYFLFEQKQAKAMLKDAHDARSDVLFCEHLLNAWRIQGRFNGINSWEDLWNLSELARIPTKMPFGKHKGELIADLPRGYTTWCLGQPDMDPYVLEAVRRTR
jgi:exodeoxyribonuclease X